MTVPTQDELDRRLDEPRAESFRFEHEGDTIKGEFVRLDQAATNGYGVAPIAVIRTDDGRLRSVWMFHEALLSRMRKLAPEPGDRIAVRYNGRQLSKSTGRRYHDYSVASGAERPATVSWADVAPGCVADGIVDHDDFEPPPDDDEPVGEPPF